MQNVGSTGQDQSSAFASYIWLLHPTPTCALRWSAPLQLALVVLVLPLPGAKGGPCMLHSVSLSSTMDTINKLACEYKITCKKHGPGLG